MNDKDLRGRDFASISPSAKALLMLKGCTGIPFAKRVAELVSMPEHFIPDMESKDIMKWVRTLHFENRYRTIDQLLSPLNAVSVLELSSGYSFRGLDAVQHKHLHYIDTDLNELTGTKLGLLAQLRSELPPAKGALDVLPLNAVNELDFISVTERFTAGPLVIVNEGLLMYLDDSEKRQVCRNIRRVLQQRGGHWITADVYIQSGQDYKASLQPDEMQQFFDRHKIREKMFPDFEQARMFFEEEGFVLDKEADPEYANCSSAKYVMALLSEEQRAQMSSMPKIHATWRLKLA